MTDRVMFAVAANKWQHPEWWTHFAEQYGMAMVDPNIEVIGALVKSQALPDDNKNHAVGKALSLLGPRRDSLTDTNRNAAVEDALDAGADWIYWHDDDTVHPLGALKRLLAVGQPFVSGVYYLKQPPCNPVAYRRREDGSYYPVVDFRRGELLTVDSVGMGCALIHREVYEAIREAHYVYQRANFSLCPVRTTDVEHVDVRAFKQIERLAGKVVGDYRIEPMRKLSDEEIDAHPLGWPYYAMEYARTEDHHFCELAAAVGYKPALDTSINCQHWGERPVSRESFLEFSLPRRLEMVREGK